MAPTRPIPSADLAAQWGDRKTGWTGTKYMWFDLAQFSRCRVFQTPPRVKRVGFTHNTVVKFACMQLLYSRVNVYLGFLSAFLNWQNYHPWSTWPSLQKDWLQSTARFSFWASLTWCLLPNKKRSRKTEGRIQGLTPFPGLRKGRHSLGSHQGGGR
jgi:hypothetical protein